MIIELCLLHIKKMIQYCCCNCYSAASYETELKHKCLEEAAFLRTRLRKEKTMAMYVPPISIRLIKQPDGSREMVYLPPQVVLCPDRTLDYTYDGRETLVAIKAAATPSLEIAEYLLKQEIFAALKRAE